MSTKDDRDEQGYTRRQIMEFRKDEVSNRDATGAKIEPKPIRKTKKGKKNA